MVPVFFTRCSEHARLASSRRSRLLAFHNAPPARPERALSSFSARYLLLHKSSSELVLSTLFTFTQVPLSTRSQHAIYSHTSSSQHVLVSISTHSRHVLSSASKWTSVFKISYNFIKQIRILQYPIILLSKYIFYNIL